MTAHVEAQGNLLAIKGSFSALGKVGGGHRGIVTSFSSQSRLRLLRKCARLSPHKVTFITLTYGRFYPDTQAAKQHLRALLERFRRKFPQASCIWRLEFQERGAPHFHLLFFELPFFPFAELRRWWNVITAYYCNGNLHRVRIEKVKTRRGVMFYAAKYAAKITQAGSDLAFFINDTYLHAGRFWGVFNKFALPYAERLYLAAEQITWVGFQQAKTYLEQFSPAKYPNLYRGKVVFTDGTINHFKILYQLLSPDFRQTFIRRFDKWEHTANGYPVCETLALPSTPHLRLNRVRVFFGRGILFAPRCTHDG
jgi:hypothetical protein